MTNDESPGTPRSGLGRSAALRAASQSVAVEMLDRRSGGSGSRAPGRSVTDNLDA